MKHLTCIAIISTSDTTPKDTFTDHLKHFAFKNGKSGLNLNQVDIIRAFEEDNGLVALNKNTQFVCGRVTIVI